LAEQQTLNLRVVGSIPTRLTIKSTGYPDLSVTLGPRHPQPNRNRSSSSNVSLENI
jgi:hypothetical protein